MTRRTYFQGNLSNSISVAGLFISLAGLAPIIGSQQTNGWFWTLLSVGLFVVAFGLTLGSSRRVFQLFSRIFLGGAVIMIESCSDADVASVHNIGKHFFGDGITDPSKIKNIQKKYRSGLQVALKKDRSGTMYVSGYFFMFPINKKCVDRIIDFTFDVSCINDSDVASHAKYGHSMYIGAIAANGLVARAELMGAIKAASDQVKRTKTKTAYAKAATDRGLKLLIDNEFEPVHPMATGKGCFYRKVLQ